MVASHNDGSVTIAEHGRRMQKVADNPVSRARKSVTWAKRRIAKVDGVHEEALERLREAERNLEQVLADEAAGLFLQIDEGYKRTKSPVARARSKVTWANNRIRKVEGMRVDALTRLFQAEAKLAQITGEKTGR